MIKNKLYEILAELLRVDVAVINSEKTADDFATWDSLAVINIALAVESEFDISLTPEQISEFNSVANIFNMLSETTA